MTATMQNPTATIEERHDFVLEGLAALALMAGTDKAFASTDRERDKAELAVNTATALSLAYMDFVESVNEQTDLQLDNGTQEERDGLQVYVDRFTDKVRAELDDLVG